MCTQCKPDIADDGVQRLIMVSESKGQTGMHLSESVAKILTQDTEGPFTGTVTSVYFGYAEGCQNPSCLSDIFLIKAEKMQTADVCADAASRQGFAYLVNNNISAGMGTAVEYDKSVGSLEYQTLLMPEIIRNKTESLPDKKPRFCSD